MPKLREFEIDEAYLTDVTVRQEVRREVKDKHDLIKAIKDPIAWSMVGSKDHDEFTKLRNHLEEIGYIETQRNCVNGDMVLKSFKLNGWALKKGRKFPSACALGNSIQCAKKFGWKNLV